MNKNYALTEEWYFQWNNPWYPVMPPDEERGKTDPKFWDRHAELQPIDLTKVCKPHDTITKTNIENSYAYYDPDTNYLYLPIKLLPEWLSRTREENLTQDEVRLAIEGMRFSRRCLGRTTKYIYKQVKFERCAPRVSHTCRCLVLDLSVPTTDYHITSEDMGRAMVAVRDGEWFPSEVTSRLLKIDSESKTIPTAVAVAKAKKAENAFKSQCLKRGLNAKELEEALDRYRRGERLPRGRKPVDAGLSAAREAAMVQEELRLFVESLSFEGAFHGPVLSHCSSTHRYPCTNPDLPEVSYQYLTSPTMFFTDSERAQLPNMDNIKAWSLVDRKVKYYLKEGCYEAYEIRELAIPLELLNTTAPHLKFRKAKTFVGVRRCVHPTLHIHVQCAIFNSNPTPKIRSKTKTQFYNDKIVELLTRLFDLKNEVLTLQERVSALEETQNAKQ